jgi:hypothetical protein
MWSLFPAGNARLSISLTPSLIVRPFGNLGRRWEDEICPAVLSSA